MFEEAFTQEEEAPKFSVQTHIDMHMEEVEAYADKEISFFDEGVKLRTITRFDVFEKSRKKLVKALKLEEMVFTHAKTNKGHGHMILHC